jgi:acetolactate synthase regulatory subunit
MNLIDNIYLFNVFIEIFNNYENAQIIYLLKCNEKINKEINDQPVLVLDNIIKNDQTFINLKILKKDFIKNNVDKFKLVINELYTIYIEKNNEFLFFFPEEYMTDEIIKLHGTALKYVPEDKITFEICEVAVKEDGFALEYVLIDKMTDKEYLQICKLAVKNKGYALKYVNTDKTANSYEYICEISVKQSGYALEYVQNDKMTDVEYINICILAVKQSGYALEYVQNDKMTDVEYINICILAVKQSGYALEYVQNDKMTIDQYIYIHELANSQISIYNS